MRNESTLCRGSRSHFRYGGNGAYSQTTMWGGQGSIALSQTQIARGAAIAIDYVITNSRGTAGDFRCQVTGPGGVITIARKDGPFVNGTAETVFYFPNDFRGNDQVSPGTNVSGVYYVQCFWYIEGYGVNGAVAAANAMFVVQ